MKTAVSSAHDEALIAVCVAEAESMATAYRIPQPAICSRRSSTRVREAALCAFHSTSTRRYQEEEEEEEDDEEEEDECTHCILLAPRWHPSGALIYEKLRPEYPTVGAVRPLLFVCNC